MILLGRDWHAADTAAMIHRTKVRKDPRGGSPWWWWHCTKCMQYGGRSNSLRGAIRSANNHAVGRLQRV